MKCKFLVNYCVSQRMSCPHDNALIRLLYIVHFYTLTCIRDFNNSTFAFWHTIVSQSRNKWVFLYDRIKIPLVVVIVSLIVSKHSSILYQHAKDNLVIVCILHENIECSIWKLSRRSVWVMKAAFGFWWGHVACVFWTVGFDWCNPPPLIFLRSCHHPSTLRLDTRCLTK